VSDIDGLGLFFSKSQQSYLVESIMQGDPDLGGAGLNLDKLTRSGVITKMFPLHTKKKKQELLTVWAKPKNFFSPQPLNLVRNYFGEEIALYFAWLGFYTQWLWIATIVGIIATIFWLVDKWSAADWAVWVSSIYAIFLSFWATFFLEYWKRKNNELNYYWGTTDFEHQEVERVDFMGEERLGIYHMDTWIAFDPEENYGFPLPSKNKYYPSRSRVSKMTSAFPILATMLAVVVVATFATLTFRLFVQNRVSLFGAIVGGVVNAIVIIVMNLLWKIVATKLTDWENHRTHSEYENNLIFKIFLFYFVNS